MRRVGRSESGAALLAALLVTSLLTTIAAALTFVTVAETLASANHGTAQEVAYAADAGLERTIADKRAAGIDVISLGIGDPDEPTYPHVVSAMQEAVADPGNQQYPSNRGREEFRRAFAEFYDRRFGVEIDPESEVIPAIGAKECIYNLCNAFLDPGDVALASDPGYPVYTGGPLLHGATAELMPLVPEKGFAPDLSAISPEIASKARLMLINFPNNPTGAVADRATFLQRGELQGERHTRGSVDDVGFVDDAARQHREVERQRGGDEEAGEKGNEAEADSVLTSPQRGEVAPKARVRGFVIIDRP